MRSSALLCIIPIRVPIPVLVSLRDFGEDGGWDLEGMTCERGEGRDW